MFPQARRIHPEPVRPGRTAPGSTRQPLPCIASSHPRPRGNSYPPTLTAHAPCTLRIAWIRCWRTELRRVRASAAAARGSAATRRVRRSGPGVPGGPSSGRGAVRVRRRQPEQYGTRGPRSPGAAGPAAAHPGSRSGSGAPSRAYGAPRPEVCTPPATRRRRAVRLHVRTGPAEAAVGWSAASSAGCSSERNFVVRRDRRTRLPFVTTDDEASGPRRRPGCLGVSRWPSRKPPECWPEHGRGR